MVQLVLHLICKDPYNIGYRLRDMPESQNPLTFGNQPHLRMSNEVHYSVRLPDDNIFSKENSNGTHEQSQKENLFDQTDV